MAEFWPKTYAKIWHAWRVPNLARILSEYQQFPIKLEGSGTFWTEHMIWMLVENCNYFTYRPISNFNCRKVLWVLFGIQSRSTSRDPQPQEFSKCNPIGRNWVQSPYLQRTYHTFQRSVHCSNITFLSDKVKNEKDFAHQPWIRLSVWVSLAVALRRATINIISTTSLNTSSSDAKRKVTVSSLGHF